MAVSVVVAVSFVSPEARAPVAWCGLVATIAVALVAAEAARRGRTVTDLRRRFAAIEANTDRRLEDQQAEMIRLAREMLPEAIVALRQGANTETALRGPLATTKDNPAFTAAHETVLRSAVTAVRDEEDLRDSTQRAFVNIARRVQAIVHTQATDLRDMEDRHGNDPHVFVDLLHIDHGTALIGRLADSIAVLGGARPGRQWQKSVPLFNVLRGAMSRILSYQRVDLHSVTEVAIQGPAVEPLIHALAELLDNATRYSPPQTRVHLTAVAVQSGVAVEIEDGGIGLTEEARERTERVLFQASTGIDLNDLGETPRLGLAVVGRLAQANGFTVSLRPSAYAGVRAVLIIPQHLITVIRTPGPRRRPGNLHTPRPMMAGPMMTGPVDDEPVVTMGPNGLPQRRRSATATIPGVGRGPAAGPPRSHRSHRATAPAPAPAPTPQPPVQPGIWLADFQEGVRGTGTPLSSRRTSDESSDKGE